MTILAGIDGCRAGWLCITKDLATGVLHSNIFSHAQTLIKQSPEPAIFAVDIPMGLSCPEPRQCDIEARKLLGKRRSSVFRAPIRSILKIDDYQQANKIHKEATGKGLTKQCHAICNKILGFDEILSGSPSLQKRIIEVHPELCFWAWNNERPMPHAKKTSDGLLARRKLIQEHFGSDALMTIRDRHFSKDVVDDDIHDAFAALWTAERIYAGCAQRVPECPDRDEKGLNMEMWY